jgi:hypothetical protein
MVVMALFRLLGSCICYTQHTQTRQQTQHTRNTQTQHTRHTHTHTHTHTPHTPHTQHTPNAHKHPTQRNTKHTGEIACDETCMWATTRVAKNTPMRKPMWRIIGFRIGVCFATCCAGRPSGPKSSNLGPTFPSWCCVTFMYQIDAFLVGHLYLI